MSQVRLLFDHDFSAHIVRGVRRRQSGINYLRARDVGLDRAADDALLEFAANERCVVVSHDVHTMSAAAYERLVKGLPMAGLFLVPQERPVRAIIEELLMIWGASEAEDWDKLVVYLPL